MSFLARDYAARHHVRRQTRGPADGLLEEVQAETLTRHPDWARRLRAIEAGSPESSVLASRDPAARRIYKNLWMTRKRRAS